MFGSQAFFGLIAAYRTKHLRKKRPAVIKYHLYPATAILVLGLYLKLTGGKSQSTIVVFFILYSIFSMGLGMTVSVWQNFFVKLFRPSHLLPAVSVMMTAQSAGRLICSFYITRYFDARELSPENSAVLFIFCGLLFFFGSFAFLITSEKSDKAELTRHGNILDFIRQAFSDTTGNRNLLKFLMSDIELYAVVAVMSFYANFAVKFHGIPAAVAAGLFVGLNFTGQIAANLTLGTLNLFSMRTKCILSRICSISAVLLLIFGTGLPVFLAASVLLGCSKAVRSLVYAPVVKKISGFEDATGIFGAAAILLLPLSIGISLLSGKLLDALSDLGGDSYRIVFAALGVVSLISLFILIRVDFTGGAESEG